jgi:hypothetical protein
VESEVEMNRSQKLRRYLVALLAIAITTVVHARCSAAMAAVAALPFTMASLLSAFALANTAFLGWVVRASWQDRSIVANAARFFFGFALGGWGSVYLGAV